MNGKIPNNLLPHLNEIAARLWSGHAAIMVGAGFSKNAKPINDSCSAFPDWNRLGELFYEKTRGEKIEDGRFLNVLRLADEVQASFGRPVLHQLLKDAIPDEEYEPSELHFDLLNLPWSDVLTTNYDTLLERASRFVTDYNYQLIVNNHSLIYSEQPRIIKLHGSFPSSEPFIISEEDYRRYPHDFAPFVNTVQQSLLENTLCLIGFSGDDPNFLRWIGWIRDNLGEDRSPKIYLIGVLNLTKAQESLLEKYNIIPLDMSGFDDVNTNDHYQGIKIFFEFCKSKKSESDSLEWPTSSKYMSPDKKQKKSLSDQVEVVISEWKEQRNSFPGWVVVPEDCRNRLFDYTRYWDGFISKSDELPIKLLIEFLYEFLWRLEKSLCPIFDHNAELIEFVLSVGREFIINASKGKDAQREDRFEGLTLNRVKEQCSFIQLTYLRYLREEGKFDCWNKNEKNMSMLLCGGDDVARYNYEKCLYSLFECDVLDLETRVKHWNVQENQPFWMAKKASLLAEMGKLNEAYALLENALKSVREKLNLRPVTSNYSDVSQESYILVLLRYVMNAKETEGTMSFQTKPEFSERWHILTQYKCDPWGELKLWEHLLTKEYKKPEKQTCQPLFDLGISSNIMHFGQYDNQELDAFMFLKFIEDAGIPLKLRNHTFASGSAIGAIKILSHSAPYWSMSTMLRIGDKKAVDGIFHRESLLKMNYLNVDALIENYIRLFTTVVLKNENYNQKSLIIQVVPELLSRLISKCSTTTRYSVFELLKNIYAYKNVEENVDASALTKRLISSINESDLFSYLPDLIDFPVGDDDDVNILYYPNPFKFTRNIKADDIYIPVDFSLSETRINEITGIIKDGKPGERKWSIAILAELSRFKLLEEEQEKNFIYALWSSLDEKQFPENTNYYKFALCHKWCPDELRGHERIKNYILQEQFQTQSGLKTSGVIMSGGNVPFAHEIIGASIFIDWSTDDTHIIFRKLLTWWDLDKESLEKYDRNSIRREFELRFEKLKLVLNEVVSKGFNFKCTDDSFALRRMVSEMSSYGLTVCSIKCAFSSLWGESELRSEVLDYYLSSNGDFIKDSIVGMNILFNSCDDGEKNILIQTCFKLLSSSMIVRDAHRVLWVLNAALSAIDSCPKYFKLYFESEVLLTLEKLISETNGFHDAFKLHDALYLREISARLAHKLSHCYDECNLPSVLLKWREICRDSNEFIEIRNEWL